MQPPKPKACGSLGGSPVTATRICLRDGRFLAYLETGVAKKDAKFKIISSHGFTGSRLDSIGASTETMEELGVYILAYDRAGHGESAPNPERSVRSEASDVEELADALEVGPKFYVMGFSLGGYAVWACLKYIPHRLAGAALMAPVINYRWHGFPKDLSAEAYYQQDVGDQWAQRVAYYAPRLLNWWLNQSWLPASTAIKGTTFLPNRLDAQLHQKAIATGGFHERRRICTLQGVHESLHRDMMVMFGKWDFDPMDLQPPNVPVHLWQGVEDGLVPVTLQRYICNRLNWINYHELPETGHFLFAVPGLGDLVLKKLLLQPQGPSSGSFGRSSREPKYKIEFHSAGSPFHPDDDQESVVMSNTQGQNYLCFLPMVDEPKNEKSIAQQNTSSMIVETDRRAKLKTPDELMEVLKGQCFVRHEGWWSYEFCYQERLRQLHLEDDGKVVQEFILGLYDPEATAAFNSNRSDISTLKDPRSKDAAQRYHAHQFTNGTICDLTNQPRETEVRFVCSDSRVVITSIKEISTCKYAITIQCPILCRHPMFQEERPKWHTINCNEMPTDDKNAEMEESFNEKQITMIEDIEVPSDNDLGKYTT